MAGKFKFDPCGSCCYLHDCAACIAGTAPEQFEVTISGIVDGVCSNCEGLNGTFVLNWISDTSPPCYEYQIDPAICTNYDRIWAAVLHLSGVYYIAVYLLSSSEGDTTLTIFLGELPDEEPDCRFFDAVECLWNFSRPAPPNETCNSQAATATVTSL